MLNEVDTTQDTTQLLQHLQGGTTLTRELHSY